MSTRDVWHALRLYEEMWREKMGVETGCPPIIDMARTELAAIEKASAVVVREEALEDWSSAHPVELADSIRLLQAIAKGSK